MGLRSVRKGSLGKKTPVALAALVVPLLAAAVIAIVLLRPAHRERIASIRRQSHTYLVVTRDMFEEGLSPWRARREGQGFRVVLRAWRAAPAPEDIREWIADATEQAGEPCRYILLVGDAAAPEEAGAPWHLPSIVGPPGHAYEGEPKPMVSDAPYGDLDRDGRIEVAVGRLPVRTAAELEVQLAKIAQFEARPPDPAFYRAVLWTGGKHYQLPMYDATLQYAADMLPDWVYPYIISGYRTSVCSGVLEEQPQVLLSALARPAFLTVVVSHGSHQNVRCGETEGREIPLSVEDVGGLESASAVGPLVMLACDAGAFFLASEQGPSLAEAFSLHPGGPVAVVASTGVVNPVTNLYMAAALAESVEAGSETIGDLLVDSRQRLSEWGGHSLKQLSRRDPLARRLSRGIAAGDVRLFETKGVVRNERLHYNLLGDPALALKKPVPMQLEVEDVGGHRLRLGGAAPPGVEELWIEHVDLNRHRSRLPRRASADERRRLFQAANRGPSLLARRKVGAGRWQVEIQLEESWLARGHRIRVMALGPSSSRYRTLALPYRPRSAVHRERVMR